MLEEPATSPLLKESEDGSFVEAVADTPPALDGDGVGSPQAARVNAVRALIIRRAEFLFFIFGAPFEFSGILRAIFFWQYAIFI